MTKVVTPSDKSITKGQAGKFCDVFADALVKSALPSEATQQVLASQGAALADEFVALVRKRVEALGGITAFPKPDFKIWRTVKYSGRDANAFRASFQAKGIQIGTYADQILDKVAFPVVGTEIDIVRTSGRQMHFKKAARRSAIYERMLGFGLIQLEPWAALEARDEYLGQPNGEWLLAGMEPIVGAFRLPELLRLGRGGGGQLWLHGSNGNAAYKWFPVVEWLFGLPRKST